MRSSENGRVQGYRKKPRAIYVLSAIFLLLPLLTVAQLVGQAGGSWDVARSVLASHYVLTECLLSWSAAAAVFVVSRWSFAYFLGLSAVVLITRVSHLATHPRAESPLGLLATAVWFAVAAYVLLSSVKAPYLNPRLRWWTRPPRLSLSCEATMKTADSALPVEILNVSQGGVFLRLGGPSAAQSALPVRLGDQVTLAMELRHSRPSAAPPLRLTATAQLVWQGKSEGPFRAGFGAKFLGLPRQQQRELTQFLRDEAKLSA